jgi:hypothetical protein
MFSHLFAFFNIHLERLLDLLLLRIFLSIEEDHLLDRNRLSLRQRFGSLWPLERSLDALIQVIIVRLWTL